MNFSTTKKQSKQFQVFHKDFKVYIQEDTIYQVSEHKIKKILPKLDSNSYFTINTIQKPNHNSYLVFTVKAPGHQLPFKISNYQEFQSAIKSLGKYCYGLGINSFSQNFVQVGRGNFATVYKYVSLFKNQKAMKMFEKKKIQNNKEKLAFFNQINILKSLNSPYILSLDFIFQTQKNYYLQTQFFEETLKTYLQTPRSRKIKKIIMKNILLAMKQMKQKNIIHRDIKPDNIMVRKNQSKEDQFVLIDFGLAAKANQSQMLHKKCGTPGFIAPQVINMNDKTKMGFQVDIFSAGATFFYMQLIELIED